MITRTFSVVFGMVITTLLLMVPGARGDYWNRATRITINNSVEIPGKVLRPGTYWIKLEATTGADMNVIDIYNSHRTALIASTLATRVARPDWAGTNTWQKGFQSEVTFAEAPGKSETVLEKWFYPNEPLGYKFVYPKREEQKLKEHQQVTVKF